MVYQYRINTTNVSPIDLNDCVLEPTDPIHELKAASIMGGLGSKARLAKYNELTRQEQSSKYFKQIEHARAMGIKPGTPAWNALFPSNT
jgi:hypothetical protein